MNVSQPNTEPSETSALLPMRHPLPMIEPEMLAPASIVVFDQMTEFLITAFSSTTTSSPRTELIIFALGLITHPLPTHDSASISASADD